MVLKVRDRLLSTPAGTQRPLHGDEMLAFARTIDLGLLDLGAYRKFSSTRYARNSVLLNERIELVAICWRAGQATAIHDHGRSQCLYLVVEGTMKEELFHAVDGREPEPLRTRIFRRGEIMLAGARDVHRITNDGKDDLVTIHLYSPPLGENMKLYGPVPWGAAADPRS
ncbi:MAG: cysteine dioxygenase [Planctomycetaceae bacterium]